MSDRAPYSRIYHSIVDDPKFATIYDDDRRLATWLRLLIVAEQAHPASAYIPEGTHRGALTALVDCGLVDIGTGRRFRIHGLDAERTRRSDAARVGGLASGRSRSVDRTVNERGTETNLAETRRDEHRQDEQNARDDEERDAITWLARHGCYLQPHSGYYRNVVTMVEAHAIRPVLEMFDRLAAAGTKKGDVKGFVFGAKDVLDGRTRPDLKALAKEERADESEAAHQRRLENTRRQLAELRGEPA